MARSPQAQTPSGGDDYSELRSLLLAPEQSRLERLQEQVERLDLTARNLSRILPDAIELRGEGDTQLTQALTPHVSDALSRSVRKRPHMIAEAIAPIMMPAIRQAIANALRSMVQSLNQTVEHSLSIRSLRWRLESFRTGKPFAEIVLLHTLLYRVEQVFLIHKDSGLLLAHAAGESVAVQDQTLVSGMLSAIRSFVQDSFGTAPGESLNTLQVGELTVWIEQGSAAILAAVIRGTPPESLRLHLQETLDRLHRERQEALAAFVGDTSSFTGSKPLLEDCLQAQFESRARTMSPLVWMLLVGLLSGAAIWGFSAYREREQWQAYLDRIRSEPGLVVTSTGTERGRLKITGLRDPLAADPASLLQESSLGPDQVVGSWSPYYALDPDLVLKRARTLLAPPASLQLVMDSSRLVADGVAPVEWLQESRALARLIPGVSLYDDRGAISQTLTQLTQEVTGAWILFESGVGAPLSTDQLREVRHLADILHRVDGLAQMVDTSVLVHITGQADALGQSETNQRLSEARAQTVLDALRPGDFGRVRFRADGIGTVSALSRHSTATNVALDRRVAFQITVAPFP